MALSFISLSGAQIHEHTQALAELRIEVFRAFPYLYDGNVSYEKNYLKVYTQSNESLVVLALHQGRAVGATTALPLKDADEAFSQTFVSKGLATGDFLYLGESVLLPEYRGQGVGNVFFDEREKHAAQLGFSRTTFCAVERSANHPLRPKDYVPLDAFWTRRGYRPHQDLVCSFDWKDIDQPGATSHRMQFWLR